MARCSHRARGCGKVSQPATDDAGWCWRRVGVAHTPVKDLHCRLAEESARIALFLPIGAGQGTQMVATFFDCDAATDPAMAKDREHSVRLGIIAHEEDNRICESVQRARHSPAVGSQVYSPYWDAMHYTLSNLLLSLLERPARVNEAS